MLVWNYHVARRPSHPTRRKQLVYHCRRHSEDSGGHFSFEVELALSCIVGGRLEATQRVLTVQMRDYVRNIDLRLQVARRLQGAPN